MVVYFAWVVDQAVAAARSEVLDRVWRRIRSRWKARHHILGPAQAAFYISGKHDAQHRSLKGPAIDAVPAAKVRMVRDDGLLHGLRGKHTKDVARQSRLVLRHDYRLVMA